jgi:hypothetical protein
MKIEFKGWGFECGRYYTGGAPWVPIGWYWYCAFAWRWRVDGVWDWRNRYFYFGKEHRPDRRSDSYLKYLSRIGQYQPDYLDSLLKKWNQ